MASKVVPFPQPKERRRALLIEALPESNPDLEGLFDERHWSVSYAANNASALVMAKIENYDVILTNARTTCAEDVDMLRRLRTVRPHTRVIILVKEWVPGDILNAIRNHAFSYFTLPIARDDLRDMIEQALHKPVWDDGIEIIQGTPEHVALAVRCDLGTLDRLTQFMRESVALPPQECEEVAFAFREVLMNAMEHGGKFDPEKFVEIGYLKSRRMVMCRVKDPGEGFSMDEIQAAELEAPIVDLSDQARAGKEGELPPGGLGILISQKFVDELIFSEKGNEVFLIKYLPQGSRGPVGEA